MDSSNRISSIWSAKVSNELKKIGILVSPGGVRSIWLRNDLNNISKKT